MKVKLLKIHSYQSNHFLNQSRGTSASRGFQCHHVRHQHAHRLAVHESLVYIIRHTVRGFDPRSTSLIKSDHFFSAQYIFRRLDVTCALEGSRRLFRQLTLLLAARRGVDEVVLDLNSTICRLCFFPPHTTRTLRRAHPDANPRLLMHIKR